MTTVPSLVSLGEIPNTWETIDVTTHDSPAGTREIVQTRKELSTIACQILWDPDDTTHQYLKTAFDNKSVEDFNVNLPNTGAGTITFSGRVTDFTIQLGGIDDRMEAAVTITRTTDITITP